MGSTNMGRVVYIDSDTKTIVTWNESVTFNVWLQVDGRWRNVDAFTHHNVHGPAGAAAAAQDWMDDRCDEYLAVRAEVAINRD